MRLDVLFSGQDLVIPAGTADKDVESLIYHSDEAAEGSVFFAIEGESEDGRKYIEDAVKKGAAAVVVRNPEELSRELQSLLRAEGTALIGTEDVRKTMALAARQFYGRPDRELLTIGVTGTKGKTTTTFMIKEILQCSGIKTGILGTIQNGWDGHFEEAERTTPQSVDVYRFLRQMADAGCRAAVMEVSSQALMHSRVWGIDFDIALFTNISPDHIGKGEHESFEEYLYWKSKLFRQAKKAVINVDDPHWQTIREACGNEIITFSADKAEGRKADYYAADPELYRNGEELGVRYMLDEQPVLVGMAGMFNGLNSLAALAVCEAAGADRKAAAEALRNIKVRGRVESVKVSEDFTVLVDYAHNGVALENLLKNLRNYNPARIITVFGCGGNRDKNRRTEMGRAAAMLSDFSVITSDNPRNEPPLEIIGDITRAMDSACGKYTTEPDRRQAIFKALQHGRPGDIIIVAGKGNETYQIINGNKKHFDDREVILSWKRGR